MEETEYKSELLESMPKVWNKFMSVLCTTNMYLKEAFLEDWTASTDTFMVVIPCLVRPGQIFQVSVF